MALTVTDVQEFDITVNGVDAAGNTEVASFASPPTWTISDDTIGTLSPSADGATCTVIAVGKLGAASVRVVGDGGPGVTPLDATFDFAVVVSAEIGFSLSASAPRPKTA